MLNKRDYVLICISEEASEVIAEIINLIELDRSEFSKVKAFSPLFLKTPVFKNFVKENNDLIGCIKLAEELGIIEFDANNEDIIKDRCDALRSNAGLDLPDMVKVILHLQCTVSKLLRFGLNHVHPANKVKGKIVLKEACYDYLAWIWLFMEEYVDHSDINFFDKKEIYAKMTKVSKYMKAALEERIITRD